MSSSCNTVGPRGGEGSRGTNVSIAMNGVQNRVQRIGPPDPLHRKTMKEHPVYQQLSGKKMVGCFFYLQLFISQVSLRIFSVWNRKTYLEK